MVIKFSKIFLFEDVALVFYVIRYWFLVFFRRFIFGDYQQFFILQQVFRQVFLDVDSFGLEGGERVRVSFRWIFLGDLCYFEVYTILVIINFGGYITYGFFQGSRQDV